MKKAYEAAAKAVFELSDYEDDCEVIARVAVDAYLKEMFLTQKRTEILTALRNGGNYCNNIVAGLLKTTMYNYGVKTANQLVDDLKLTKLLGIEKVSEDEN